MFSNKQTTSYKTKACLCLFLLSLQTLCTDADILLEGQAYPKNELVLKQRHSDLWQRAKSYMIASDAAEASHAAAKMLRQGGNVIDAAVCLSFVISVVRPQSTGLGGGGFLLLHWNGKTNAFDFRERAPLRAHEKMYENAAKNASLFGIKAVAVPGMVAGLVHIHRQYGKLTLKTVIEPAVQLAENGFHIYPALAKAIDKAYPDMGPAMRQVFSKKTGSDGNKRKKLKSGDILIQKDLARTLKLIGKQGKKSLLSGTDSKGPRRFHAKKRRLDYFQRLTKISGFSNKALMVNLP